jgi:HEAT repeat protein
MHLSRRSLLAAGVGAICAGAANAQPPQKGTIVGQPSSPSSDLKMRVGGKSLKEWIEEIRSIDPSRRENAIRTVPMLKGAEEAIPALIERVERDNDSSPRVNAVMALGAIDFTKEEDVIHAVKALAKRLTEDTQSIIRFQCALVLGRFGARARPAMPELIRATKDLGSWEIRKAAVFAVTRVATDVSQTVNPLAVDALTSRMYASVEQSTLVRLEATMSICTIGRVSVDESKRIVTALKAAESDKEKALRIWARVGLCVHDNALTKKDMATLIGFLKDKDLPARTHAARAIGTIASVGNPGDLIKDTILPLTDMLGDSEEHGQIAAIWALGQIGAAAQPALKRLNEMLEDKKISDEGKNFIREAVKMIQPKGKN